MAKKKSKGARRSKKLKPGRPVKKTQTLSLVRAGGILGESQD